MAHDSPGPPARRLLGRIRRIQRLDLPADTARELAAGSSRRGWLSIRLRRALCIAATLSGGTHTRNTGRPRGNGAHCKHRDLWLAVADPSPLTQYRLSGLFSPRNETDQQPDRPNLRITSRNVSWLLPLSSATMALLVLLTTPTGA